MKEKQGIRIDALLLGGVLIGGLELCHFDGDYGAFIALVTEAASAAVFGLLEVVGGKKTKHHGNSARRIQAGDTLGDTLTDIVEVGRLTTDNTSQDDHSIVAVVERHLVGTVDQLERAGNGLHMDILGQGSVLLEGGYTAIEQGACDLRIPLGHHHTERHVRCIGHGVEVVIAEVMKCGSHITLQMRARCMRRWSDTAVS